MSEIEQWHLRQWFLNASYRYWCNRVLQVFNKTRSNSWTRAHAPASKHCKDMVQMKCAAFSKQLMKTGNECLAGTWQFRHMNNFCESMMLLIHPISHMSDPLARRQRFLLYRDFKSCSGSFWSLMKRKAMTDHNQLLRLAYIAQH